ncbi:MAG: prepilin-type N-terminal cleavage/methylation domain-containing protein [bacterium]|nr:prepilin-type N-terminal cleavage/methylation domain-containing protein [bacterium]MDZ4299734.1 prepilin-type N-terminal cleavage/methylation domain-containing protein [Candidatus Sungbacteria bacterium]
MVFYFFRQTRVKKNGFTLLELLIIIAIIGILTTIIIAAVQTAKAQARDVRRLLDMRNIQTGLQLYFDKQREYPDALTNLVPDIFPTLPSDPLGGGGVNVYSYIPLVNASGAVCGVGVSCLYYHIGMNLETTGSAALKVDADECPAAGAGCADVLAGTTISGADTAGCSGEAGRSCVDKVPN